MEKIKLCGPSLVYATLPTVAAMTEEERATYRDCVATGSVWIVVEVVNTTLRQCGEALSRKEYVELMKLPHVEVKCVPVRPNADPFYAASIDEWRRLQ